jgi:hypothetical protein
MLFSISKNPKIQKNHVIHLIKKVKVFELIHTSQPSNFSTASNFSPLVSFEYIIVVMRRFRTLT